MRSSVYALFALVLILLTAAPSGAETYGRTGFHIDWWDTEDGGQGYQYHIPIEAGGNLGRFSYKLLTAYACNRIERYDGTAFDFSGLVDTRLNMAYDIIDRWPVDMLLALDLNLPTGQTKLSDEAFVSILDPDKVTLTRMGEGFNINPSLVVLKQWNAWLAAVGVGYIWRGEYDATDTLTDYDPGDALNLTAEVDYSFSLRWVGRLFGSYTHFGEDQAADRDIFQPGDVGIVGAAAAYSRARWDVSALVKAILRDKDSSPDVFGALVTDENSYYGDEWIYRLRGNYQLTDRLAVGAWVQYLAIAANDYPASDPYYLSRREKALLGAQLVFRPAPHWETGLEIQGYRMNVADNPYGTDANKDFAGGAAAVWITAGY